MSRLINDKQMAKLKASHGGIAKIAQAFNDNTNVALFALHAIEEIKYCIEQTQAEHAKVLAGVIEAKKDREASRAQ
jgi:hypothetical protein